MLYYYYNDHFDSFYSDCHEDGLSIVKNKGSSSVTEGRGRGGKTQNAAMSVLLGIGKRNLIEPRICNLIDL